MVRKNTLYTLLLFGWGGTVFAATVAVFSGNATPLVSPSAVPLDGPASLALFAGVPLVSGAVVIVALRKRAWRRAGQRAGLTPNGLNLVGTPALVGTEDGRTVTGRTVSRKTGSSEGGSGHTTYTVVEAELDSPASDRIIVGLTDESEFGEVATQVETTSVGGYSVLTDAPERAENLLTGRTRTALEAPEEMETVFVGDAAGLLLDSLPEAEGMIAGALTGAMESQMQEKFPGDAAMVTTQTKGLLLDASELERQATAVAAVASEFEATAQR